MVNNRFYDYFVLSEQCSSQKIVAKKHLLYITAKFFNKKVHFLVVACLAGRLPLAFFSFLPVEV